MLYNPFNNPEPVFIHPIVLASWYDSFLAAIKDGAVAVWEWLSEAMTWLAGEVLNLIFAAMPLDWKGAVEAAIAQALPTMAIVNQWLPFTFGLDLLSAYITFFMIYLPISYLVKLL